MNCIRMKISFRKSVLNVLIWGVMMLFAYPLSAQTNGKPSKGLYELFSTKIPDGAQWEKPDNRYVRDGGYSKKSENYIYLDDSKSPAKLTGLSIPIRENPGPGEYR